VSRPGRQALVTGGAGFIGGHLVEALLAAGWRVRILDDLSTGREENLAGVRERVDLRRGDVRDPAALASALEGVEVVFHQAAVASVVRSLDEPVETDAVNTGGTLAVLEGARRAGVGRVVFAASCAAYGDAPELPKREDQAPRPLAPYALQKVTGEAYCRLYHELHGLPTVCLRYFNVYGPRQDPAGDYAAAIPRFVEAARAGRPPRIFGDGLQTRDFVYVGDVARANLLAADAAPAVGRVVNVGSGVETSVVELAGLVVRLCGSTAEPVHEPARSGEVRRSVADPARARELLGFEARVGLEEGLARTIEAWGPPARPAAAVGGEGARA